MGLLTSFMMAKASHSECYTMEWSSVFTCLCLVPESVYGNLKQITRPKRHVLLGEPDSTYCIDHTAI